MVDEGARIRDGLELVIIRHGQTPGNRERRYVGALDQPLSDEGRKQAQEKIAAYAALLPDVERVYVTTLRRTHETASILFPGVQQIVVEGIQEMDFGQFAGRTADEMADDAAYREWVEGYCEGPCPGGEAKPEFTDRVCDSLSRMLRGAWARGERRVVLVAHGGTMMASLSRFSADEQRSYYEWNTGNCEGYRIDVRFSDCDEARLEAGSRVNCDGNGMSFFNVRDLFAL